MTTWTSERVASAVGAACNGSLTFSGVSTDTRTLSSGALFVALVGEHFDAHDFLQQAKDSGAAGAVVRRGTPPNDGLVFFEVDDTLDALGRLARNRRREIDGPVLAITGTNGKTSIREMLSALLGTRFRVHATCENWNNLIGVPLTVLSAPADCDALVIEAGASELGEIARLREIVEPSLSIVTNVAAGHLDGFGTLEGILQEKTALLDGVPIAVVGTNPPALAARARKRSAKVIVAGLQATADRQPDAWGINDDGCGWFELERKRFTLSLIGRHQVENAVIALAVALEVGVQLDDAVGALSTVAIPPGRCELLRQGDRVIIQDTYNANPDSLMALLETARAIRKGAPLVVILGTMLELGDESETWHAQMADAVMDVGPSLVGVTGDFITAFERHRIKLGTRLVTAPDPETLGQRVAKRMPLRALVLVKASRGVRLEKAVPHLLSTDETPCSTTS